MKQFEIKEIDKKTAIDIVIKQHYLHRTTPCRFSFGLFLNNEIVGVIIYGNTASASLRKGICGPENFNNIYELTRLWLQPGLPKNSASFFIANTIKLLDKEIIVSYADPSQQHLGIVYQACNFIYTGLSTAFRDPVLLDNPNQHHTSFAKGMTNEQIKETFGDNVVFKERVRKYRYVYFNATRKRRKGLIKSLKYKICPYPKFLADKYLIKALPENQRRCKDCREIKNLTEFRKAPIYKGNVYRVHKCKSCESYKNRPKEFKDKRNAHRRTEEFKKVRQEKRKTEQVREKEREYDRKYLKNNPMFKLKKNLRNRIRMALKVKKWFKKTRFYDYIGCSQEQLKTHLETQFQKGMTWDNYGAVWEIDHILPLSFAEDANEMYNLCHFSNLQPLLVQDNQTKTDTVVFSKYPF